MKRFIRLSVVISAVVYMVSSGFNCAKQNMHGFSVANSTANDRSLLAKGGDFPLSVLNAEQTFSSMMHIVGIDTPTAQMRAEYNLRSSSLLDVSTIQSINAPLMLSATSLAGEVCNGLIAKERALTAEQRKFFTTVDFTRGPSSLSASQYEAVVDNFSKNVYGRDLKSEEEALFVGFYNDFLATLTPTTITQAAQTSALNLSVCSAFLSSFEFLTF